MKFKVFRRVNLKTQNTAGKVTHMLYEEGKIMVRIKDIKFCEETILYFDDYFAHLLDSCDISNTPKKYTSKGSCYTVCTHVYLRSDLDIIEFYVPMKLYDFAEYVENGLIS